MVDVTSIVVNSIALSSLYALIAIGFTLIFGVGGVLNFAYGGQVTLGAFIGFHVVVVWGGSVWLAVLLSGLISALLGLVLYLGVVRFIEEEAIAVMLITFLVGFSLEHLLRVFYSSDTISIPIFIEGAAVVAEQRVLYNSLFIIAFSWLFIVAVFFFVNRTEPGKALIALSNSEKGAKLVGITPLRINIYTWTLAGLFAGVVGIVLLSVRGGSWQMGLGPLLLAFSIVILGGLGSIKGSVIGAYIIGTFEVITITLIDASLLGAASLVILLLVLTIRPQGLYGREALGDF